MSISRKWLEPINTVYIYSILNWSCFLQLPDIFRFTPQVFRLGAFFMPSPVRFAESDRHKAAVVQQANLPLRLQLGQVHADGVAFG